MPTYPDISNLPVNSTIGDFLALPNNSLPSFWGWILAGIWFIIVLRMYFVQKEKQANVNLLSIMAVASLAIMLLATVGTLAGFVTSQVMLFTVVLGFLLIGIWFFSGR